MTKSYISINVTSHPPQPHFQPCRIVIAICQSNQFKARAASFVVATMERSVRRRLFDGYQLGGGCQPDGGCQPRPPIRIGTDCSGLDVPVAMLEEILHGRSRKVRHVFSSENDPRTLKILLRNFDPEFHYTDVTRRADRCGQKGAIHPAADSLPALDIYAAGFPCQPFASCGLSAGLKDARGAVWLPLFRFIAIALPRAVILENVVGLIRGKHKSTFEAMVTLLKSMEEYDWHHTCLNTQDFGVPQNRPRVYIAGIRRGQAAKPFAWPAASPPTVASPQLDDFLDVATEPLSDLISTLPPAGTKKRMKVLCAIEKVIDQGMSPLNTPAVCSAGNRRCAMMLNRSPCLTRGRAMTHGHWLIHRGRMMTCQEIFRLQGLKPERWVRPAGVSKMHFMGAAGNAMSGNVVKAVLLSVLEALGEL